MAREHSSISDILGRRLLRGGWIALLAISALATCKGGERAPSLGDQNTDQGPGIPISNGGSSSTPHDGGVDAAGVANCGDIVCRGAGRCVEIESGAACICDAGYQLVGNECVVDETCIKLRLLESGCRQRVSGEPAVAIFFGLETCAGTTVVPEVLGDINAAFKVQENGGDLADEGYAALLTRPVESYLVIALDLSGSLQRERALLVSLVGQLKRMVTALEPDPGEPLVSIELLVFGRSVDLAQGFTTDFSRILAELDAIQADPAGAITEPGGTNVFGAVNAGMRNLQDKLLARLNESSGAVVATGTLVTVTDGRDSAGVSLSDIDKRLNLISVGISANIDDQELTRIGPQGSFLAPSQADWVNAFDRVAERVSEYPERSYMVAYCSTAVAGIHDVSVTLANLTARENAECWFRASNFGVGEAACNSDYISNYCSADGCGTFLACGARCETPDGGIIPSQPWSFTEPLEKRPRE